MTASAVRVVVGSLYAGRHNMVVFSTHQSVNLLVLTDSRSKRMVGR